MNMDEAYYQKWNAVCSKLDSQGYSNLSRNEQLWIDIRCLIDATNNGGLISYFYNSGADRLNECMDALHILGADLIRVQVERICALFPDGVPKTVVERNKVINSWNDDEELDRLLADVDRKMYEQIGVLEEKLHKFLVDNGLI